jgi:hypothetical protein
MKSNVIEDPVSRVRMRFEPEGENLIVQNWIEPGGGLAPAPTTGSAGG